MPRAEMGSTKHLSNKMKSKGLQRLRWYCQVCEKQCRDENGFKCHTQSESHVRQMLIVGEDPRKHVESYSNEFLRNFLQLLRTSHGEKQVNINHFYQEVIAEKEHVHMNATKWPSLTEFAKFLGRSGKCRVEETEKGLFISWIDDSPEALRRQEAIRKKERQDKGDEEREQKLIEQQVRRAHMDKAATEKEGSEEADETARALQRNEGEKIKLNFGAKPAATSTAAAKPLSPPSSNESEAAGGQVTATEAASKEEKENPAGVAAETPAAAQPEKVSLKFGAAASKPKNVFAAASKKNALGGKRPTATEAPKRPMSEAERIMKEEIERQKSRGPKGFKALNNKRQKVL